MAYPIQAGIQLSFNGINWYSLTDHNRQPIQMDVELIENQARMANGSLRKYIVSKKYKIATNWSFLPTKTSETVDVNHGAAWLESFYQTNAGVPVYLKIVMSEIDPSAILGFAPDDYNFQSAVHNATTYSVFITSFTKTIVKRTKVCDYVNMSIEFTEI